MPVAVFFVSPSSAWEQAACDFTEVSNVGVGVGVVEEEDDED